ncbi:hypothetical protein FWJ25_05695 [Marinobacter salinexigens]|uniref:Uncharacterized protein n=1 Tax=Marinobacter salinexigens TaxID=2919747 RepID=A0A5B0VK86_9GAMM|nr:hypothetical protein [Marinobacter salinexigens]KAA1174874.1 hypothetical protein FWJ25_05695 [Marinobacter salinexigens]
MAIFAALNSCPNTVIFRRALPFVYGLIQNSGQKPERQKYTDTIEEFERRAPIRLAGTAKENRRTPGTPGLAKKRQLDWHREKKKPNGKPSGDIAKIHCHARPGRPAYEYDVRPRHLCEPENG